MSNTKQQNPPDPVEELLDEYYPFGTVVANDDVDDDKAELMTRLLKHRRDEFKAKINRLLVEARIDEVNELGMKYLIDPNDARDRIKELNNQLNEQDK